jgi:uncharacterized membrane protein
MKIFAKKLAPNNRKAAILTLFIFILPVLLIMLGFSVDLAYMHLVQTELRLASDNAARVAADNLSRYEDMENAAEAGVGIAQQFTVAGRPLRLREGDFDFGRATVDEGGSYIFETQIASMVQFLCSSVAWWATKTTRPMLLQRLPSLTSISAWYSTVQQA